MTLKTMEYEDAPSGFVTLYNYKEPFMRFDGGYGLRGTLLFDGKTERVQCHLCGEWHAYLPNHLKKEHNMCASAYKEKVGLNQSTALLCESQRARLIANGLEARKKNLVPGALHKSKARKSSYKKIRLTLEKNTDENKNIVGTCPAQLLDRLVRLYEKLGRMPVHDEIGFLKTLRKTYGSLARACQLAGLKYRKPGENVSHVGNHIDDGTLIAGILDFRKINGRDPSKSDFRRGLMPSYATYMRRFGSLEDALDAADCHV